VLLRNVARYSAAVMKAVAAKWPHQSFLPTTGVKVPDTEGFKTWDEDHIASFEAAHPVGSRARLAMSLLLYTAQRRSDVIRMGPQHIRHGVIEVRQRKTGTSLCIPVHPELREVLDKTPSLHMTFLTTQQGKPFSDKGFGN
jgi:integrase